jgi:hypothetical protein
MRNEGSALGRAQRTVRIAGADPAAAATLGERVQPPHGEWQAGGEERLWVSPGQGAHRSEGDDGKGARGRQGFGAEVRKQWGL